MNSNILRGNLAIVIIAYFFKVEYSKAFEKSSKKRIIKIELPKKFARITYRKIVKSMI